MLLVIFGPPGCGKTETGKRIVHAGVDSGDVALEEVAYVAFGKAASMEAAERCGVTEEQWRHLWFRTLHSTGYRLMGENKPAVMDGKKRQQFGHEVGIDFGPEDREGRKEEEEVEDLYFQLFRMTDGAHHHEGKELLRIYQLSRLQCKDAAELKEADKSQHPATLELKLVRPSRYRAFVEAYRRFKSREGVIDYVDMLAHVVESDVWAPLWKLVVIDEAQDFTPLMWGAAERLMFNSEKVVLLGDDDQCVFSWMGAKAEDFLSYRAPGNVRVLRQTHRFGQDIVDFARRIAERLSHRQVKDVIGKKGMQHKISTEYEFDPAAFEGVVDGTTGAVLHRHVAGCRALGARMMLAGIPYWNERGANPLGKTIERNGYLAFLNLLNHGGLGHEELMHLVNVVPSRKEVDEGNVTLVRHGAKKQIREMIGPQVKQRYGMDDLSTFFSPVFMNALRGGDPVWLKVKYRQYYDLLLKRGFDLAQDKPKIVISTIHGYKGREAGTVAVFTETFPKLMGREEEHRVAYVGATRTRGNLQIVCERLVGDWTQQYPYPL